jgi:RND family efflux transporter MFP subunit
VEIAAANRDKAGAAVQAAQAAYDRRGQVSGSAEALALQRATWDYDIAKAQYEQAMQTQRSWQYDLQLLQESVVVAEANIKKLTTAVDPALSQDVARNQLAVDRLTTNIANGRIYAPFDGEITLVSVTPGRTTQAYRGVLSVAQPGALEASADLLSSTVQQLSVGQKCTITMSNYPSRVFTGVIRRIPATSSATALVEEDRSTRITISDATDVTLERGALVRVTVLLQQKDAVLWVPLVALRTFQGKDFVLVLEGETQRRVPVTVGIRTEDRVEILSGLTAGQTVVGP